MADKVKTSSEMGQEFRDLVSEHVEALRKTAEAYLSTNQKAGDNVPRELRVQISVGLNNPDGDAPAPAANAGRDCWDATYICGKGPTGYMYCTRKVCIEIGPVEVLPA